MASGVGRSQTTTSAVLDLQSLATDSSQDIADLLRKALLVATKLRLEDFRQWINTELHGYPAKCKVPEYRNLQCDLRLKNPYVGLIPLIVPDKKLERMLSRVPFGASISEVMSSIGGDPEGTLVIPFTGGEKQFIMEATGTNFEAFRIVNRTELVGIVDRVRTTILEWSLQLEDSGIMGDGMTFSQEEKRIAAAASGVHIGNFINNFQGNLGNVTNSTLSLHATITQGDIGALFTHLTSQGVEETELEELQEAIRSDPQPTDSQKLGPAVSAWIGKMISKAASGTWSIAAPAAAELLARSLAAYYGVPQ